MNLFDNMHGLKGCIRCLTFKNVLLAHFLLAFSGQRIFLVGKLSFKRIA